MSSTTSPRDPVFSSEDTNRFLCSNNWSFNVFPCPCELFLNIASATYYYKSRKGLDTDRSDELRKVEYYRQALGQSKGRSLGDHQEDRLTECYRSAAILYINGLFQFPLRTLETSGLISSIMLHAKELLPVTSWKSSLVWPLYQVGLESTGGDENALWIEEFFRTLSLSSGCQHSLNGLAALKSVWQAGSVLDRTQVSALTSEGQLVLV